MRAGEKVGASMVPASDVSEKPKQIRRQRQVHQQEGIATDIAKLFFEHRCHRSAQERGAKRRKRRRGADRTISGRGSGGSLGLPEVFAEILRAEPVPQE